MEAEAAKAQAEQEAANAPTEKDMINDIRENRRRERRQVSYSKLFSMTLYDDHIRSRLER